MGKRQERVESDPGLTAEGRRHWSAEHARRMLGAWSRSGLSLSAFARQQGVNAERLRWWHKRLDADKDNPATLTFIPAVVSGQRSPVVLRLPHGIEVEVADVTAVPPQWLVAVVRALEGQG
jgi:transposase-like protein